MIGHPVHNLRAKKKGTVLTADQFNRVLSGVQLALRRRVPLGLTTNAYHLTRLQPDAATKLLMFPGQVFAAQNYAPNRWIYALREMIWNTSINGWAILAGGRTTRVGTDDFAKPALNGCEASNDALGFETVGINFDGALLSGSGFEVIEIKNQPVVAVLPMRTAALGSGGGIELDDPIPGPPAEPAFWFSIPNVIDGECDPPPSPAPPATALARASCSCSSCSLSVSMSGPGIAVLPNGTIAVRAGLGLAYAIDGDLMVKATGMLYTTLVGGLQLRPPRLDVYDAAGGQAITAAATVALDRLRISEADTTDPRGPSIEWTDDDEILVHATGRLVVGYQLSVSMTGPGEHEGKCYLQLDSGSGYSTVAGTDAWIGAPPTLVVLKRSTSGQVTLDVLRGDLVRFRAERTAGSTPLTAIAGGSRISALLEQK